jgi:hypothetical protein
MLYQTHRVRSVQLTAPREELIRRGALLLEDALHTASLPETSHGRLLLIRSLHVGTIRADQSAATLSLTLERRLHDIMPLAVHASDPAAPAREAVYFRDDVEPAIMLVLRLIRRQSTAAWFWRLAVPAWKPTMALDEALRTVFFTVTRTRAGLMAAVRLAHELAAQDTLDTLLQVIRRQDGSGLLRAFGWSKPASIAANVLLPDAPSPVTIPAPWRTVFAHWIPQWGEDDPRAVWLAGVALVAQNPVRLLDPTLMTQASRLMSLVSDAPSDRTAKESGSSNIPRPLSQPQSLPLPHIRREVQPPYASPLPLVEQDGEGEQSRLAPQPMAPFVHDLRPVEPQPPRMRSAVATGIETDYPLSQDVPVSPDTSASSSPAPWPDTPLATQHAGLFFLIPVLTRLGMAEFLTPRRLAAAFPLRLLRFIGQHLGLPDHDPLHAVLGTEATDDLAAPFVAPASWQDGIANPGVLVVQRVSDAPGTRVLFDATGRLPLAQWRRHLPESLHQRVREAGLRRHPAPYPAPAWHGEVMLRAWLLATRRWLRRQARLGLADVVRRPGRMTATRTHLDLFFALDQADIRIRRAGLDIDPGWVPWLGRVIYFHYQEPRR